MQNNHLRISVYTVSDFSDLQNVVGDHGAQLLSQSVRVHLQNSRQGTVACKDRSKLISRSNRKPWKQKGTGRARAGTARSPLWRGGGVALGPVARVGVLSINKKQRILACVYSLLEKVKEQKVVKCDFVPTRKTKDSVAYLKSVGLAEKKITLLYDPNDMITFYSFVNIPVVQLVSYDAVFSYVLADSAHIVILEKDVSLFNDLVKQWQTVSIN